MNGTNPYDCSSCIALEVDRIHYPALHIYVNFRVSGDLQKQEKIYNHSL